MNYDLELQREITSLGSRRPRLLLHACCAPCSVPALERLAAHFELTVFYYNPNIMTSGEFEKRLGEMRRLSSPTKIIVPKYDHDEFLSAVCGLENEPESGARCHKCFELRMKKAAGAALSEACEYVTSTISTGPRKDAEAVNSCGKTAAENSGLKWLPADFKKRGGYQQSVRRSKELGLYRQDFCGCEFSTALVTLKASE